MSNPFQPLYDLCNSQNIGHKLTNVIPYPRFIDVEFTNMCAFKCNFCPTGIGNTKREKGFMSKRLFEKIVTESNLHGGIPLRFVGWGEPTLHPQSLDFIRMTKKAGLLTHLTTSGATLVQVDDCKAYLYDPETIATLLTLDSIKFSFQGVDRETYDRARGRDFFNDLRSTVQFFHAQRGKKKLPWIQVGTTITDESQTKVEWFRDIMKPICDEVQVGRTVMDYVELSGIRNKRLERQAELLKEGGSPVIQIRGACDQVFDVMSVNWDGKVSACCSDFDNYMTVGDLNKDNIEAIWQSERYDNYRWLVVTGNTRKLPLCEVCYDYNQLRIPGIQRL